MMGAMGLKANGNRWPGTWDLAPDWNLLKCGSGGTVTTWGAGSTRLCQTCWFPFPLPAPQPSLASRADALPMFRLGHRGICEHCADTSGRELLAQCRGLTGLGAAPRRCPAVVFLQHFPSAHPQLATPNPARCQAPCPALPAAGQPHLVIRQQATPSIAKLCCQVRQPGSFLCSVHRMRAVPHGLDDPYCIVFYP